MEKKSIFESKEQYLEFISNWKKAANNPEGPKLTFEHFLLYAMFRGKDWKKCMSDKSLDETKTEAEYIIYKKDHRYMSLWPFGDLHTEQLLINARNEMEIN